MDGMKLVDLFLQYEPQLKDEHVFEEDSIDPWASLRAVYQNFNREPEKPSPIPQRKPKKPSPLTMRQISLMKPADQASYLVDYHPPSPSGAYMDDLY